MNPWNLVEQVQQHNAKQQHVDGNFRSARRISFYNIQAHTKKDYYNLAGF